MKTFLIAVLACAFMVTGCEAKPTKKEDAKAKTKVIIAQGCPAGMVVVKQKNSMLACKLNTPNPTLCPPGTENVPQKSGHIIGCKAR